MGDTYTSIEGLAGSAFNDTLTGDSGNNVLEGGLGTNVLDGGNGSDTASYLHAAGAVTVSLAVAGAQNTGGAGTDTLVSIENLAGSAFGDTLTGNAAANSLSGNDGDDLLIGGAGADILDGGAGNDYVAIPQRLHRGGRVAGKPIAQHRRGGRRHLHFDRDCAGLISPTPWRR